MISKFCYNILKKGLDYFLHILPLSLSHSTQYNVITISHNAANCTQGLCTVTFDAVQRNYHFT